MNNPIDAHLFQRLADNFTEAFRLDAQQGEDTASSAVEELHQTCLADGLTDSYIRLARKTGAVSLFSNGVISL